MNDLFRRVLTIGVLVLLLGSTGSVFFKANVSVSVLAAGATVYVDDDNVAGPWDGTVLHPYQNITSGIEHASDGDTVHALGGTYVENVVVDKSITLEGESKPVINGMTGHGIDITANNVTIEGFNITYSGYCIYTSASGFSIRNNVFWHDFNYDFYGVYWYISETGLAEDYTVYAGVVEGNEFYMSGMYDAIRVNVGLDYGSNSGYTVEIGNFQVCNNTFYMEGSRARGIDIGKLIRSLYGGTVSVGVLNVSENTMYGGDYGINFYGYLDDLQDVQASVGDVIVNDNILVNQSSYSMYVDYYDGTYLYGNTVGTYGDLIIRGNTITSVYSTDGIYLSDIGYWENFYDNASLEVGNVCIEENEIDVGGDGIYFYGYDVGYDLYDNSSFTMGHILVRDNTINSGGQGINVGFEFFGNYMYGNSSFSMGNIEFSGNVLEPSGWGQYGIYIYLNYFGYDIVESSSFTMGSIVINNNTITSGYGGIYFQGLYFGNTMQGVSSFTIGNIEIIGNTINCTDWGIDFEGLYEYGYYMYGSSSFTMGHVLVNDNTINSGYEGIYVNDLMYLGYHMYGASTFTIGNIEISANKISSGGSGIDIATFSNLGDYMYNDATFTMDNVRLNDNTISSGWYGIVAYNMHQFGREMHGNSSVLMNNIEFCRNIINSTVDALGIGNLCDFGTYMYDNSSFSMGNVLANDNTFYSYIWLTSFGRFGAYLYENSSCTIGDVEFGRNLIYGKGADGITFYDLQPFGFEMYNYSLFSMGDFSVNNNVITSDGSHSGITCTEGSGGFGINIYDNAVAITGSFEFEGNDISSTWCGLVLGRVEDAMIINNTLWNSNYGIYLSESAGNLVYHNNFVNNTIQAYVTSNYTNAWDNGYPSGGNYWSDYTDVDNSSGQYQNETGSDGIWDHPYVIDANNTDRYPFSSLYDGIAPTIGIPSRTPSGVVLPNQEVTVAVNVTDSLSGVMNATLYYTIDNGLNWNSTEMLKNIGTGLYEATIPGQEYGKTVRFRIEAFDYAGNNQTRDGLETYCVYEIVPEFSMPFAFVAFMIAMLLLTVVLRKRKRLT
jgi:parallel beta-helix repeat protein